jgi:hypothetical protein
VRRGRISGDAATTTTATTTATTTTMTAAAAAAAAAVAAAAARGTAVPWKSVRPYLLAYFTSVVDTADGINAADIYVNDVDVGAEGGGEREGELDIYTGGVGGDGGRSGGGGGGGEGGGEGDCDGPRPLSDGDAAALYSKLTGRKATTINTATADGSADGVGTGGGGRGCGGSGGGSGGSGGGSGGGGVVDVNGSTTVLLARFAAVWPWIE